MNPGNPWTVFRGYLAVVVEHCGNAMNKEWVGRLGAVDVLGIRQCVDDGRVLRIDYNVLRPFRSLQEGI